MTILSQGAEATIERSEKYVFKRRITKNYRISEIDSKLRKSRTNRELKILKKSKDLGINVPEVYDCKEYFVIKMDYVEGKRLRDELLEKPESGHLLKTVGEWLAILHENDILHGDLTTSNVLIDIHGKLFLIDFGLSFSSKKIEDRAVDLHLFEQAIESTHYLYEKEFFDEFLKGYNNYSKSDEVLERLKIVRKRGRNKH